MAAKQMVFEADAREAIRRGVEKLSKAVTSTLGPRGRNAVLDKGWGAPMITKDGVTVAEEVQLTDPYEDLGAKLVKEVASKTSDVAGDGTTTATLLTEAIFTQGLRAITSGSSHARLVAGLSDGKNAVIEALDKLAKKISTDPSTRKAEVQQVATISANNDPRVGKIIAEAMEKVGTDGVITVEEGKTLDTEVSVVEGMQFDRGFISPHFVTDPQAMEVVFEKPLILVYEDKISNVTKLLPLLEAIKNAGRPFLIIAEDVESEALATLVVNKLRGILQCCAVKAPGYGDRRKAMLQDIAVVTGAKPVMKDLGLELDKVTLRDLGTARRVVVTSENTTIVDGGGSRKEVEDRVTQIRAEIETTTSDYDREKLQERLAKLTGGIAQINVGGATETEVKERKALIEDALHSTRAAVESGILPGGGVALLRAREAVRKLRKKEGLDEDYNAGLEVLHFALARPVQKISENAGFDGTVIAHKILREKNPNYGFDANTGQFGDMTKFGILDPAKVTKTALENAVSVALLLLSTDALIVAKPETKKKGPMGGPGGPGGEMDDMGGGMDF